MAKNAVFGEETLKTIGDLYLLARPYADAVGVDPFLAMGGPAEELHTINTDPFWESPLNYNLDILVGGYPAWVPSWMKPTGEYSHNDILRNYTESDKVNIDDGISMGEKWENPVLADLGYANIKLKTAITLLNDYNKNFPNDDPLDLKRYNTDLKTLAKDLSMDAPLNATAKFAVLQAKEAVDFFQGQAPGTWQNADLLKRLGLVATYYNRGREKMNAAASQAEQSGAYNPVPELGGDIAADNGWPLALAVGRDLPFTAGSLARGRTADRASVQGYSGDHGPRRDNQDPAAYGAWRGRARESDSPRGRRGPERRSQAAPEIVPSGLLGPAPTRFAAFADGYGEPAEAGLAGSYRSDDRSYTSGSGRDVRLPSANIAAAPSPSMLSGVAAAGLPAALGLALSGGGLLGGLLRAGFRGTGGLLGEGRY